MSEYLLPHSYSEARDRGDWELALRCLEPCPPEPVVLASRHEILIALKRFPEAFETGERFLDAKPARFDMRQFWCPVSGLEQRLEIRGALGALGTFKGPPWARYYFAALSPGLEGFSEIEGHPGLLEERYRWMNVMLGRQYLLASQFGLAFEHLRKVAGSAPLDWRVHAVLGETLICLKREKQALAELDRGVEAASGEEGQALQARAWKGEILLWVGRYARAEEELSAACEMVSHFAYTWRAAATLKRGSARKALPHFEEARRKMPADPELPPWQGECLRLSGRPEDALTCLNAGPNGLFTRVNRALCFAELGQREGFERDYWSVPAHMRAYAKAKIGLREDQATTFKQRRDVLEALLQCARGYRRDDDYGRWIWMS